MCRGFPSWAKVSVLTEQLGFFEVLVWLAAVFQDSAQQLGFSRFRWTFHILHLSAIKPVLTCRLPLIMLKFMNRPIRALLSSLCYRGGCLSPSSFLLSLKLRAFVFPSSAAPLPPCTCCQSTSLDDLILEILSNALKPHL